MSRIRSLGIVVLLGAPLGLLTTTSTADAAVTGNCTATASFITGTKARGPFTVDTATIGNDTIKVRRSDTVEWKGGVPAPPRNVLRVRQDRSPAAGSRCHGRDLEG